MKIFQYIIAFFRLILVLLNALYHMYWSVFLVVSKRFNQERALRITRSWGRSTLEIMKVKVEVQGSFPERKTLILPNHRSYLDVFVVLGYYPSMIVSKKEVGRWPIVRVAIKIHKIILVDRSSNRSRVKTIESIIKVLNGGSSVILFPEGTTHIGPLTKNFKTGTFRIASENNIPVVPVAIDYKDDRDAWIDDDTFVGHFFRQMGKPVSHVKLRFGPKLHNEDHRVLLSQSKEWIDESLVKMRKEYNKIKSQSDDLLPGQAI